MKIYKISSNLEIIKGIIQSLNIDDFQRIEGLDDILNNNGWSAELSMYDGGECYIAISYSYWTNEFIVEKYYDSEFLNDSFGKSFRISVNLDNPDDTILKVNKAIDKCK
jgi:hypothetical protein